MTRIEITSMARFPAAVLVLSLASLIGCGSSAPVDQDSAPPAESSAASGSGPSPSDVVSQFLDEVRRGGQDSLAQQLLTQRAQHELTRIGHSVQPIGSPDARFSVTRAETVPGEKNAALVHTLWSEPSEDGSRQDYQVVWAVERETAGWRISGLAIEVAPNQPPQIIDFENRQQMTKLLASDAPAAESAQVAEQSPDSAVAR